MDPAPTPRRRQTWLAWLVPLGLAVVVMLVPVPAGLSPAAWRYVALFTFVIASLITEPLPGAAMGLLGVGVAAALGLVGDTPAESVRWALSGFSNDVVWLVFAATTFALGYEVTGLGRRIALVLVRALGRRTLGLGYAIAIADLLLAPFMPSNTARSAGTIYPIVRSIPLLYGSTPLENRRAIGAYLSWTAFAATSVTSMLFLTAMAPNLLAVELARTVAGVEITWMSWLAASWPVGSILFILTPLVTYVVYPPSVTSGGPVIAWAGDELDRIGGLTRREGLMAGLAVVALLCWMFGGAVIAPVTVALLVVVLMVVGGVVSWTDILGHAHGWNVLVWFATLIALAEGLSQVGFLRWVAERSAGALSGLPVTTTAVLLVTILSVMRYLFASATAHTSSALPAFLAVVASIDGMPVRPVVMTMLFSIGLMGVLTPYACGPAPAWHGSGYVTSREFWRLGAIFGLVYLAALVAIGLPYVWYLAE